MAKKQQTVTKKQPQTAPFYFQCHKPDESTRKQPAVYGVSDLESIKKNGVEGYDAVVLVDVKTNQITAISNVLDCSMEDVRKTPLHLQAAQAAITAAQTALTAAATLPLLPAHTEPLTRSRRAAR